MTRSDTIHPRAPGVPPLRLAVEQFHPVKGEVAGNLGRVRERIAAAAGVHDVVVFPETALSGYFVEGGVIEVARTVAEVAEGLGPAGPDAPDVVIGHWERDEAGLWNALGWFEPADGGYRAVHVHRKLFLPTYGVFDEARFVSAGHDVRAFDTRFGRVGLLVCEDLWHSLPSAILALDGAGLLVVASAAPARELTPEGEGSPVSLRRWHRLARTTAEEHGVFVAVAQLVGSEGGKVLSGGSIVVAPSGATLATGPDFDEATVVAELHGAAIGRTRAASPLLADLAEVLPRLRSSLDAALMRWGRGIDGPAADPRPSGPRPAAGGLQGRVGPAVRTSLVADDPALLAIDPALVERMLVHFIRDEVRRRRGFERVVLGVSGGIDSAVSLALACRALGPDNVVGFRLPYATSSADSLEHAELVLTQFGAESRTIDITPAVDGYLTVHEPGAAGVRRGNVMARMRAIVLFDQSAGLLALPLGTGNKSERLLGYYTWHADDSPPINPLGDLYKTQVVALARHLGIPDVIIDKPASADLVQGVTDADEIGIDYERADPILYWLVRGFSPDELVHGGFDPDEVALVHRRLSGSHWKRERPTVAMVSNTAIGEFYLRPVDY